MLTLAIFTYGQRIAIIWIFLYNQDTYSCLYIERIHYDVVNSLVYTVHFNKVRQTASALLCFDLLPKQSIGHEFSPITIFKPALLSNFSTYFFIKLD